MKKERIEKSLSQLIALKIGDYVIETPKVKFGWDQLYGARANIHAIIDWFVGFAVVLAIGFIVYSGIQFMTSAGDAEKVTSARKMLTASVIGMVIVLLSRVIILFFIETFFE
ncbi:hypothetical protein GX618_01455 [Candidatus Dojkabacteria bacterium]|jgi:hypothetical protein|uniref:Uncharacterized protein n=1 Tax=Candidatus Dojkabacteria bacterium TaxID=2099670 RepID=A0A847ET66_9BACT|nr:hypothetical protein [Candidatus Dojkabacteria bacterium]HRX43701.1 hypothetical protein [Candidatus Dojkabacteria bacterium]